jgi:hypothetical protein
MPSTKLVTAKRKTTKPLRDYAVLVRFTQTEHQTLSAVKGRESYSSFIRRLALQERQRSKPPMSQINQQTYVQLARASVNLNQLTKAVNTIQKSGDSIPIDLACLDELQVVIAQLRLELVGAEHQLTERGEDDEGDES